MTMPRWPAGPKLTPKIILEGTRLTHKTDLAFALNEHPRIVGPRRYRYHSTMAWQRIHRGVDEDFGWLEARLAPLGFHVVLCTCRPETFAAAREERLKVSGKPDQYDDLRVFLREQDVLRGLAAASRLPVLELDMSDGDLDRACDTIADWMTETGGLWAPGE